MATYDPRQVRNVLIAQEHCTEIIPPDDNIRYFQNGKGLAQLHLNERLEEIQIDIMCENLQLDCKAFREMLRKDKKHRK